MSLSRKKMCCDEMPLFSVTQKLRLNAHLKGGFKRPCCGKQNEGKESKQSKCREGKQRTVHDENRSIRKQRKKKYLQQEIQRMKQHQQLDENMRFAPFQEYSACEISVLKEDMREMKDVISKLTIQERREQKQDPARTQVESDKICANLKHQIDELQEQLQILRETNFKLEEAHIQSQLYAKQTAQLSQNIKQELNDLANKHLSCEQTYSQLQQQTKIIQSLNQELSTCRETISEERMKRQFLSKGMAEQMEKLSERSIQIEGLQKEKAQLHSSLQKLTHQFEEAKTKLTQNQLQATAFSQQKAGLLQKRQLLEEQCTKLQQELKQASLDLRDTRFKLGSLGSMEQKCQELYQEIKRERLKWDATTLQEQLQKQKLDMDLTTLQSERDSLHETMESLNRQQIQLEQASEQLKAQNKRLFEDRVNLAKQNRNLQIQLTQVQAQLQQTINQNEQLLTKSNDQQSSFQQQKSKWLKEKEKIQTRLEWLSRQKTAIEQQVNGTLEAVKKRHDDILMKNAELQRQLTVQQQKLIDLQTAHDSITDQNQTYKTALGQKELKLIQQQAILTHSQQEVNQLRDQVKEAQNSAQESKLQWQAKYAETKVQLENCQASLQLWKQKFEQQTKQLAQRNQKYDALRAQIEQASLQQSHLFHKIEAIETQLKDSQSVRFELSEELSCIQNSTKRNTELLEEEKSMYEREINLKNKCISDLKSTIKLVKDQSLRIMEEIERYREETEASTRREHSSEIEMKYQQFSTLIQAQLLNLRGRIDNLTVQKNELERVLTFLRASNNELTDRIYKISSDGQWNSDTEKQKKSLEEGNRMIDQLRQQVQKSDKLREQYVKQLQIKEKQIEMLHEILQEQRKQFALQLEDKHTKIDLTQSIISEQSDTSQKLNKIIEEKDQTIKKLTERIATYEEKRIKIVAQVQTIQNRICELADKNSILEQENKQLELDLSRSEGQLRLTQERMKLMLEHKLALQQQKAALEDQITRVKLQQQKSRRQFKEIIQIYENRKGEAIGSLQLKIRQLANELSSNIEKLTLKNKQIDQLEQKCIKIQQVLEDNHQLLKQERTEREKLLKGQNQFAAQIQNYKNQIACKQRQAEASSRDCTSQRQHLDDLEARLSSMKRKYESAEHDRSMAQREIQNHQVSIRILREQNRNIQKVMSDQLLQRKSMIEQLINEKRMLYSQLHHE